jgi:hypothetical protein
MEVRGSHPARRVERRVVTRGFSAFTLDLEKRLFREGAVLDDFRIGPGHEGLRPLDDNVASFHYDGQVYFNIMAEVVRHTRVLEKEGFMSARK